MTGNSQFAESEYDDASALETAKNSLNSDGSYMVQKGDLYIGINYTFENDEYLELMTVCKKGEVVDCGRNCPLERFMYKEEYLGKTYEQAFLDFYYINAPVEGYGVPVRITILIMEKDKKSKYDDVLARIRDAIAPDAETDYLTDDEKHFNEAIEDTAKDIAARMEDEGRRRIEESENEARIEVKRLAEEEERRREEEERRKEEEWLFSPVASVADIKERYEKGVTDFTLASDIAIDMSDGFPTYIKLDCDGHSVTLKGIYRENFKDHERGIEIWNAGSVDLSGLVIDRTAINDEDFIPETDSMSPSDNAYIGIVTICDTFYKNVTFPSDIPLKETFDERDLSIFEGYLVCEISDEGDRESITYVGPITSYEKRQEWEEAVVTEILTKGDAYDLLGEDYHGEVLLYTDISVDVGSVTLPEQDYMGMSLKPGAKLKVSGRIALTGGKLDWTVSEAGQLDITGLTLVKKHPSPDMVKIRYNSAAGINTALLQARAASGTIKFALGDSSYDITIW